MVRHSAENQKKYRKRQKRDNPEYLAKERLRGLMNYVPSHLLTKKMRDERNRRARESAARQRAGTARPQISEGQQPVPPSPSCSSTCSTGKYFTGYLVITIVPQLKVTNVCNIICALALFLKIKKC